MTEPEAYVDGCLNCERDTSDCHPVAYVYYGNYLCQLCCVELVEGFFEAFVKGGNRGAQGGKTMRLERERPLDSAAGARRVLNLLDERVALLKGTNLASCAPYFEGRHIGEMAATEMAADALRRALGEVHGFVTSVRGERRKS